MNLHAGRFLTLEGIEGVGKTTQAARIAGFLADHGIECIVTREPGGTVLAEEIRSLVLRAHGESMPATAELLMMFAARAVHLANRIEPALDKGKWVICDRFTDATFAYQGAGRGMLDEDIRFLENFVQGSRRPDLTLLLDTSVESGLARSTKRNVGKERDRFEQERSQFFERVRGGYLARARAEPDRIAVIDASAAPDAVTASIVAVLSSKAWIS